MTVPDSETSAEPSHFHIEGAFDAEGRLQYYADSIVVKGWAITGPDKGVLNVYHDGVTLSTIYPDSERADVILVHPSAPLRCGFTSEIPIDALPANSRADARITFKFEHEGRTLKQASFPLAVGTPQYNVHIDTTLVRDGRLIVTTSNTHLVGWCIAQDHILGMSVEVGTDSVLPVHYGIARSDVLGSNRKNPNGLYTGFSLFIRDLPEGDTDLTFRIQMRGGHIGRKKFIVHALKVTELPTARHRQYPERRFWRLASLRVSRTRWILVVLDRETRRSRTTDPGLAATVQSTCDCSPGVMTLLPNRFRKEYANRTAVRFYKDLSDLRSKLAGQDSNVFVSFICAGDTFEPTACDVLTANTSSGTALVYWDEYHRTESTNTLIRKTPGAPFVTEFHLNTIGRGWATRLTREALESIHSRETIAAHPLERFYSVPERCIHIAEQLSSHIYDSLPGAIDSLSLAAREAVLGIIPTRYGVFDRLTRPKAADYKKARELALTVSPTTCPLVSIVIPTVGAQGRVLKCLRDIRERTDYKSLEIIVLDHTAHDASNLELRCDLRKLADRVLPVIGPFNWSLFNNMGAAVSSGDILLFLNDDVEVASEGWISEILCYLNFERIGIVGPRLLLPGGNYVQSAGISLLSRAGWARNDFAFSERDQSLAGGSNLVPRNCSSLLGAAIAVPRNLFMRLGGFDERLALTFNDLDFSLRARNMGYQVVCTPRAELIHHEKTSRSEISENQMEPSYWTRWRDIHWSGDPYWHPAIERDSGIYKIDPEPIEAIWRAGILAIRQEISRILLLRLDHVGDFVLSIPAFQQLRKAFPGAAIDIVVGSWNVQLAEASQLFDNIHTLNLYDERSGNGRAIDNAESQIVLSKVLRSTCYDLAADFRPDGDTRFLLRDVNAKCRAGFSHGMRYPWLDISVEWEGNLPQWRKSSNASVQLRRLTSAIEDAFPVAQSDPMLWPESLFSKAKQSGMGARSTLVVIHPFAGNEIKMWPSWCWESLTSFISRAGGRTALIGTEADRNAYPDIVDAIVSAGGIDQIAAFDLPRLVTYLAQADCFVGVDSGPKHLAASVGIPTIGIQSGFVDPVVWSPNSDKGISIVKRVSCAPCYLDDIRHCIRKHDCMHNIEPAVVFRYLSALTGLRENGRPN